MVSGVYSALMELLMEMSRTFSIGHVVDFQASVLKYQNMFSLCAPSILLYSKYRAHFNMNQCTVMLIILIHIWAHKHGPGAPPALESTISHENVCALAEHFGALVGHTLPLQQCVSLYVKAHFILNRLLASKNRGAWAACPPPLRLISGRKPAVCPKTSSYGCDPSESSRDFRRSFLSVLRCSYDEM